MKKAIIVGLALIPILLFTTSCGVAQEEYDRVSSDLAAAQTQIQSLQGDLSTKETELSAKETELEAAQIEIQSLQSDLSAKETELEATQTEIQSLQSDLSAKETELSVKGSKLEAAEEKLEQGKARIELLNAIFIPAITGELAGMTASETMSYFLEWRDNIIAIGDLTLTAKFQAIMDTGSDEATMSFFLYLLESIPEALE